MGLKGNGNGEIETEIEKKKRTQKKSSVLTLPPSSACCGEMPSPTAFDRDVSLDEFSNWELDVLLSLSYRKTRGP